MVAYITGTSAGIGKALAEKLLDNGISVVGLSRNCTISHSNYKHLSIDLSDLNQVSEFEFENHQNEDVILINNAGTIGAIRPIGKQSDQEIIALANINIVALQLLCNKFIAAFHISNQSYQIINISSGAGKRPIDAWAPYCASKAAVDLFSETMAEELKARAHHNWHIFSIAPGVVDTAMQNEIRSSNPSEFLQHQRFIDLKNDGELKSSNYVASQLFRVIESPKKFENVVMSVRDM